MKCWDCPYLKIIYEPMKDGEHCTPGKIKCEKHNLMDYYFNRVELKNLECIKSWIQQHD